MTLYNLGESNILKLSGTKTVTEVPVQLAFNYLSLQNELDKEEAKRVRNQGKNTVRSF